MNQRTSEAELTVIKDGGVLDEYMKGLWDRVQAAGELITELRSVKKELSERVESLQSELITLRTEFQQREQDLKRLRAERAQILSSDGKTGFTEEERETLRARIHELISKINSHL